MLAGKKQEHGAFQAPQKSVEASPSDAVAPARASDAHAHVSPARALQKRLARELVQPARAWMWHSAGLVMVAILALWIAGAMLNASL